MGNGKPVWRSDRCARCGRRRDAHERVRTIRHGLRLGWTWARAVENGMTVCVRFAVGKPKAKPLTVRATTVAIH
jgi:hypothetical protein